jgi:hypothetical protein
VLLFAGGGPVAAAAAAEGQVPVATAASVHQPQRGRKGSTLEDRVNALAKSLDLDPQQQEGLRRVLLAQREETLAVWADQSIPAAARVKGTELIGERTADRIRALLNDKQRARYTEPRPAQQAAPGSARPSVETWMNKTNAT